MGEDGNRMIDREALAAALAQVQEEEIEYQPGYWVWQMEVEIRDLFVARLRERLAQLPPYPPALVERIAEHLVEVIEHFNEVDVADITVAVLDALNTETP